MGLISRVSSRTYREEFEMSKLDPDRIVAESSPIVAESEITEVRPNLAIMYPISGNSITDYLSKYSIWNWDIKEVNEANLKNYKSVEVGLGNNALHDYKDKSKHTIGH